MGRGGYPTPTPTLFRVFRTTSLAKVYAPTFVRRTTL